MADREYLNSGTLFQNKVKKNPKSPDYQGDMLLDLSALGIGTGKAKLRIAGWKKTSSKGTTFLSLNISEFKEREEGGYPKAQAPRPQYDDENEPF
jgi:hypothetical protein